MARSLLSLTQLRPGELRELLTRASLLNLGPAPQLSSSSAVPVLCASARPYARWAVEAGLSRLGLRASVFQPVEVDALGDGAAAGGTMGSTSCGIVLVGWTAERAVAFAAAAPVPVLAIESGAGDPLGALADLLVLERVAALPTHRICVVGDPSPRAIDASVALASLGASVAFAHPVGFAPDPERLTLVRERAAAAGGAVLDTTELIEGLRDASAVIVEPWPEGEAERFRPIAVQRHQLRVVRAGCGILHRQPERRGAELSASLLDDAAWWAPQQRALAPLAAAALVQSMFSPDPWRSVIG